jgi:mono/diheme cytochrome c family protein
VPVGLVREPGQGQLVVGDPLTISLHVAGDYDTADHALDIQLLSNPDDLTSWVTIATTTAHDGSFSADVQPVTNAVDAARWPRGGVLRLRVVDDGGRALPVDATAPDDSVIVVVNPATTPTGWTFLVEKSPGSIAETTEYYAAIGAPATLDAFMTTYGFPGDETTAVYYNAADLGIGREMHCRATTVGGLACYVRNFGIFGGDKDDAIAQLAAAGTPLATVAMVYTPPIDAPNAVAFMVYGPNNSLVNEAQLDTHGDNKSVPQNCLNCHGGRSHYDLATHAAIGARFLSFDPSSFAYAPRADLTFQAQEDKFRRLDRLVATAAPSGAELELIEGMFPAANTPFDPGFVPAGWNATAADARVYRDVIAPHCRSCHVSFENTPGDPLSLATAESVRARASTVIGRVCSIGPRGMPAAEQTTLQFFNSPARAVLLHWLNLPGACAPGQ